MNDQYTEHAEVRQFPPDPPLRVCATFPASDGRVPEEIVIEVGGTFPVDPHLIDRAVNALARVAAGRDLAGSYKIVHGDVHNAGLLRTLEEARAGAAAAARDGARRVRDGEEALAAANGGSGVA